MSCVGGEHELKSYDEVDGYLYDDRILVKYFSDTHFDRILRL